MGVAKPIPDFTGKTYQSTGRFALEDTAALVNTVSKRIADEHNVYPTLIPNEGYIKLEKEYLMEFISDAAIIDKAQAFAAEKAQSETDRNTYQAMEAFVHNLNTMHSRAGAQVPFSSINYGTDTSPEGRMVIKNILLATEAGLGNGETPIFPVHIQG